MIAICMRRQALPEKVMPEWEEMCAVASAVQNLWLAATAHGIAGEHLGRFLHIAPTIAILFVRIGG